MANDVKLMSSSSPFTSLGEDTNPHPWLDQDADYEVFENTLAIQWAVIFEIIVAIVKAYQQNQKEEAEKRFRDEVLGRLQAIQSQLAALQRQLTELGVRLLHAIGEVRVEVAEDRLVGWLGAVQTAYPKFPSDPQRAVELFDELNASTRAATRYGPASLPLVGPAFTTLINVLYVSGQLEGPGGPEVLKQFKKVYRQALLPHADPKQKGSLPAQQKLLSGLVTRAHRNLKRIEPGKHHMGTHGYGTIDVYVTVSGDAESGFKFKRSEKERPRREKPEGTGPGDRRYLEDVLDVSSEFEALAEAAGVDLLLYTSGARELPEPDSYFDRFGGDRHGSIYDNWIKAMTTGCAVNIAVRNGIKARLKSLEETERLLESMLDFCAS